MTTNYPTESYQYYKMLFSAHLRAAKKRGETKLPEALPQVVWGCFKPKASNYDIVYYQYHRFSPEMAKHIQQDFSDYGIKLSFLQAAHYEWTDDDYLRLGNRRINYYETEQEEICKALGVERWRR